MKAPHLVATYLVTEETNELVVLLDQIEMLRMNAVSES